MNRYTFLTIQVEEVMEVPGEIIETYTNRPFSSGQFVALVELHDSVKDTDGVEETPESEIPEESGENVSKRVKDPVPVDYGEIDGVGESTAKNLANIGIKNERDVRKFSTDELEEVDGVGPTTAENIKEYVEE